METSLLLDFAETQGINTDAFKQCSEETQKTIVRIQGLYDTPPFSPDADMVVYGSIARRECIAGSDIDWTLLVDGQADPKHLDMMADMRKKLKDADFKHPGSSGMFGQVSFSHELIHNIGGQGDTNHNLTKRILLLLESRKISFGPQTEEEVGAYDRIVKGILNQYVQHDSGLNSDRQAIPRFLLNDVVRYWRTMCVDFAYKQKEQGGEKWALRNIKLRTSRKLLYVKGLLMCFSHYGTKPDKSEMIKSLYEMIPLNPIELLIKQKDHFQLNDSDVKTVIEHYGMFLATLNNRKIRESMEELNMEDIYNNATFKKLRGIADQLQNGIDNLFIKRESELQRLTLKYGIF